jgi:hypothetical protein
MDSFRTRSPATYIPPTNEEMREMAQKVGLKSFSPDLVADLCNLAAGGIINPPSVYRETVWQVAEKALPAPDQNGRWEISPKARKLFGDKSITQNRSEAIAAKAEVLMRYHQNV